MNRSARRSLTSSTSPWRISAFSRCSTTVPSATSIQESNPNPTRAIDPASRPAATAMTPSTML
jgi:hypothetical protein